MKKLCILLVVLILASCGLDREPSQYLRWVGDSEFDPKMDTSRFELCSYEYLVKQYFHFEQGLKYKGEKKELKAIFDKEYIPVESNQSGFIRIRFIVNCKGETGRFRLISSDLDYKEQVFDEKITSQLLSITQSLDGWEVQSMDDKPRDFYQYLIFEIRDGQLVNIMP